MIDKISNELLSLIVKKTSAIIDILKGDHFLLLILLKKLKMMF